MRNKIQFQKPTPKDYDGAKQNRILFDEYGQMSIPEGKSFKIGSVFYLYCSATLFWFRFFDGYGLHGKRIKCSIELFSERNGYEKYIRLFGWKFRILKPNRN